MTYYKLTISDIMKRIIHFATFLTIIALLAPSCEERPGKEGTVTIHGDTEILLPPTQTDTSISFTATAAWTAMTEDAQWLGIEPDGGAAGEITARISALANSDTASRTATVRILCGTSETSLTVRQEGLDTNTPDDDPDMPAGRLIKTLFITDGTDDNYEYLFSYDENGRLTRVEMTEEFVSGSDNISLNFLYDIDYSDEKIVISGQEEDYTVSFEAVLDDQGRAVSAVYTDIGENGYGEVEEIRTEISFSYDKEGQLTSETGKEDGYNEYINEYIWSGGNLINTQSDYSRYEFTYSDYPDNSNIDINWYSFDPEGYLTSIIKTVPQYRTTYRQVYRYELEDPNLLPDENGYYHYGVILVPVGDPETVSTETLEPRITDVEIGY